MSSCYISINLKMYSYAAIENSLGDLHCERLDCIIDEHFEEMSFSSYNPCKGCSSTTYCFGTVAAIQNRIDDQPMCWRNPFFRNKNDKQTKPLHSTVY
jgi:hypothetical protein